MLHLSNTTEPLRDYLFQLASMDAYEFSKFLKNECEEEQDKLDLPPVFLDLLNAAISEIDFLEIAQTIIEDYNEQHEL